MNFSANIDQQSIRASAVSAWLVNYISSLLDITKEQVTLDKPFSRFGLDSASIAAMTGELSQWLGTEIDPSIAYDYATINKISDYLSHHLSSIPADMQHAISDLNS